MMCSSGQSEKAGARIEGFIYPAKNEIPEFEASKQRTNGDAGIICVCGLLPALNPIR